MPRKIVRSLTVVTSTVVIASVTAWWISSRQLQPSEILHDRFMSYVTSISPLQRLQLAQLHQTEIFERKSEAHIFNERLKLPDVVVSASIPVEYNYYIELSESWKIEASNSELRITAPALKPSTPAANISALNFEVKKGSFFRNETAVTQGLKNQITPLLQQRAYNNLPMIKEVARNQLEDLVQRWAESENTDWHIQVIFQNEIPVNKSSR